ncbi:ventricular zone-expressed PH domain-containing protein homolog 1-like [Oppia nitens]|uniref:ventricular zone-expressed PH domain-containing protein homolog 1-like n=1 Tax=Oppia nitens TaxID=1686743 RepID=UPI0023DB9BBD|nr:ventricular zone-expressed PH domain-containing protein homolog 1-like [Oppia nitens]
MHQLFVEVLAKRDLSKAGDLFSIDDKSIVEDLSELIHHIQKISSASNFLDKHNDQSVVEICLTRITSAIRDTGTIEEHAGALVGLLESCLMHDLMPSNKDEDPPHAKIASDVVSCIFLNHSKKSVMRLAVPIAVKLLHRGNKELSRNLSSYLSLAAINNADVLSPHIQPIIDSIIGGNYSLARVLPKIYTVNKEPIHDHIMALVCLLPQCDTPERLSLLNLFALISKNRPSILETNLPQFMDCLTQSQTAYPTLQIFLDMAQNNAKPFQEYVHRVITASEAQTGMLSIAAQFLGLVGKLNASKARECLKFLTNQLSKSDLSTMITLLREIKSIAEAFPQVLPSFLPQIVSQTENSTSSTVQSYLQQISSINNNNNNNSNNGTSGGGGGGAGAITIVRVNCDNSGINGISGSAGQTNVGGGGGVVGSNTNSTSYFTSSSTTGSSNQKKSSILSESTFSSPFKSTGSNRLGTSNIHVIHRSIPRLHIVSGGHIIGRHSSSNVHRSLTALMMANPSTSRHQMNRMSIESVNAPTTGGSQKSASSSYLMALAEKESETAKSSKAVATSVDSQLQSHAQNVTSSSSSSSHYNLKLSKSELFSNSSGGGGGGNNKSRDNKSPNHQQSGGGGGQQPLMQSQLSRLSTTSAAISEPFPMRDAVQHFCEKHIDKIKSYMQKIFVKIPLPVKCTIEERKAKKVAKLHFVCQGKGEHCLYSKTYFIMKTRNARIWIHLMFLALQAKASAAISTRETSVDALKNCWDSLKADNKTFLTLVTSSFPSAKDQDLLNHELRSQRYFDVFEFNAIVQIWGCFLCNHPEKANGFLKSNEPVIEGQLKEKKGKWKLFRRWRTRYFTLSGIQLSYREANGDKDGEPVEIGQIQSVRAIGSSRGRTIPKAFEIFANEKTYVLKAKNSLNNEQWVQCLSIAMAHSQAKEDIPKVMVYSII